MTDRAAAKANERANKEAGNLAVRGWIAAEDKPEFDAMVHRAKERVNKLKDGEVNNED